MGAPVAPPGAESYAHDPANCTVSAGKVHSEGATSRGWSHGRIFFLGIDPPAHRKRSSRRAAGEKSYAHDAANCTVSAGKVHSGGAAEGGGWILGASNRATELL